MRLRASSVGAPTAVSALDVALHTGGLANGTYTIASGVPGATVRWRNTGDLNTRWRGHIDNDYLVYAGLIVQGSVGTDFPHAAEPRELQNGSIAYVRVSDNVSAGSDRLQFVYKTSRVGAWTGVAVGNTVVFPAVPTVTTRPGWCVLPSGRILVYALNADTDRVDAYTSTDNGLTWSLWSTNTQIVNSCSTICVETVGDAICIVTGANETSANETMRVYWSVDAGQTFSMTHSLATTGLVRTCVTSTGQVLLAYSVATIGVVVPVLYGGGIGASVTTWTVRSAHPAFALAAHDDGTIWLVYNSYTADPVTALNYYVSIDNGASFSVLHGSWPAIYDNKSGPGTPRGFNRLVAGSWRGSIVVIAVTDPATAAYANGNAELWFGGYDSITEAHIGGSGADERYGYSYEWAGLVGDEIPSDLGWNRSDAGTGAVVTTTANGINIVSDATNYSMFDCPGHPTGANAAARRRYAFRVNSGGSILANTATLGAAFGDGANRQPWRIRHSTDAIRLVDNAGTIASSASVSNQFTAFTEVLVAWANDYPTAGGGLISVWYRIAGQTHWTVLAENKALAEEAGVATEFLTIGAETTVVGAANWDVKFHALAEGGASLTDGFVNPTDLHGRALSAAVDMSITNRIKIGGVGGPGIHGDTYTVGTTYHYAARNLWLSPRLSCRWQTATDGVQHTAVLNNAGNSWRGNIVTVHGTNYPTATIQFSDSNAWISPAAVVSADMSAVVWEGGIEAGGDGYITTHGSPWIPHRWRSSTGRRWFVMIGNTAHEIADNSDNTLFITNASLASSVPNAGTASMKVFGDRMGVILPALTTRTHARLVIDAADTVDGGYRTGLVVVNEGHEVTTDYDSGFVDRYIPNTRATETTSGHVQVTVLGPEHPELRIAWGLVDRGSSDYLDRVVELFRSLRGNSLPVVFWRDTDDVSTLGLYRVSGPVVKENSYGELYTELARLAQLILREETT